MQNWGRIDVHKTLNSLVFEGFGNAPYRHLSVFEVVYSLLQIFFRWEGLKQDKFGASESNFKQVTWTFAAHGSMQNGGRC